MKKARYRVGGLGTFCGGTKWAAAVLVESGLDVGHECLEKPGRKYRDGIVCGFLVWRGRYYSRLHEWGWDNVHFDHVIRAVRHPLQSAQSLHTNVKDGPWRHPDKLLQALRFWVATHEEIDRWHPGLILSVGADPTRYEREWRDIKEALGLSGDDPPVVPPRGHKPNNRLPLLTWAQWTERDPEWAERGRLICRRLRLEELER